MEHGHNQTTRGLTRLDLLAVAIIIIILAAVFGPPFLNRRPGPHKSPCQSNMKECVIALHLYCNDYDDTLPSSTLVSHSNKWSRRDFLRFATLRGERSRPKTWSQVLDAHMKNKDIMFCPSDDVDQADPRSRVSYWWKAAIDKAWYGVGCGKPCRRMEDFVYDADQIVLFERKQFHLGERDGLTNGARINAAYLDSHVAIETIANATSGDPINCAANSDGEPMYFNFDNSRPKGPGNPRPARIPATYIDPGKYSDHLP